MRLLALLSSIGWTALWLAVCPALPAAVITVSPVAQDAERWMADLCPAGPLPEDEQAAWLDAMRRFAERAERDDISALTQFLEQFPAGMWAAPLRVRLAEELYLTGHYSQAVRMLEELWQDRGRSGAPGGGLVYARGGVKLAEWYARLGRREDVERVLAELEPLHLVPADTEIMRSIHQGLATMRAHPETAFRCGALALERIRVFLNTTNAGHQAVLASRSSSRGMSLAEVAVLAAELGMNYQVAFRSADARLVTPSVMHLRLGHFVAVLRERQGKAQIEDPTGWETTFASRAAIEAEASGYFLIPPGELPPGWRRVEGAEAATVFGRNGILDNDPDGAGRRDVRLQCGGGEGRSAVSGRASHGMATHDVHLMLVSQQIIDTPIGYEPPFGPTVYVTLRHTQRSNERFGYRPTWTHSWSGQLYENPRTPLGDVWVQDEGGWERFVPLDEEGTTYQGRVFNVGRLTRTTRTNLVWEFPDGTKRIYTTPAPANVVWARIFHLTGVEDAAGNRVTIQVLPNGRVESMTDPLGRSTRFFYELANPGIPPTTDPVVFPVTSNQDYTNQVTRMVDPFGRTATFQYAKVERDLTGFCGGTPCTFRYYNYDLTNITDVAGLNSQFVYDWSGTCVTNLITPYGTTTFRWTSPYAGRYSMEVTDPEGDTERIEFGAYGNDNDPLWQLPAGMLAQSGNLDGRTVAHWGKKAYAASYQPDSLTGATLYTFQLGETLEAAGRVLEGLKRPLENRIWFNYPGQGSPLLPGIGDRPTRIGRVLDDGTTQLWQTDRDSWGNIVRSVDPLGRTFTYVYAANFIDLLEVRQVRGAPSERLMRATYNDQHQPLTITDAAGQTTRHAYNPRGQLTQVVNARGETTDFIYDANGYLTALDGPLPGTQDRNTFEYDAFGRVHTATDPDGYVVTFDYDVLDRITRITFPDGTAQQVTYDRLEIGAVRDRLNRETRYRYDGLRRLTAIQDALGRVTSFQWCGCGDLEAILDPLGRMTRWHRDVQGRIIAKEYADGSRVAYEYEHTTSRLRRLRDEQNQVIEYTYDLADALTGKRYLDARRPTADVSFAYNAHYQRLTAMTDAEGTTTFQYHPITEPPVFGAGRLAVVDGPWANDEVTYQYDELGRTIRRAINGVAVARGYDAAGRLNRLTNALGAFDYAWDAGSPRLAGVTYPNGQHTEYTYFGTVRDQMLQRITHFLPGGAKLSEFTYAYNSANQITEWSQSQGGRLWTWAAGYDAADRLTNLVETLAGSPDTTYTYLYDAADNRILEQIGADRHEFTYDVLNQLTSLSTNTPVPPAAYEWDAENRLVAISSRTRRTEFGYDGLDRRTRIVERENGNVTRERRYLWSGATLCEERDATGGVVLKRFADHGVQVEPGAELPTGHYFYTRDHLSSVREMVDNGGAARASYRYAPAGAQTQLTGDLQAEFGFTGHLLHGPSGLLLAPYRPYDPRLGRWLSRDPIGEDAGENLYQYVGGAHLSFFSVTKGPERQLCASCQKSGA